jgi:hypothetical protein
LARHAVTKAFWHSITDDNPGHSLHAMWIDCSHPATRAASRGDDHEQDPAVARAGLNTRQRLYLSAMYNFDQAAETEMKRQSIHSRAGRLDRPRAARDRPRRRVAAYRAHVLAAGPPARTAGCQVVVSAPCRG